MSDFTKTQQDFFHPPDLTQKSNLGEKLKLQINLSSLKNLEHLPIMALLTLAQPQTTFLLDQGKATTKKVRHGYELGV